MNGEFTPPPVNTPRSPEQKTLADILRRDENEPAMLQSVLRAVDIVNLKIDSAKERADKAEDALTVAEEELSIDPTTGLWTVRKFDQEVEAWANRPGASLDTKIAVVFIDMNNLKAINDASGHDVGDMAIKTLADKIRDIADYGLREGDFRAVSRSNKQGDEFMLALPAREADDLHDGEQGDDITTAVREKINTLIAAGHKDNYFATGSVFATRREILENGLDLYKVLADRQMYQNKTRMKAQVQHQLNEHDADVGTYQI